jgi:hypothetical protein
VFGATIHFTKCGVIYDIEMVGVFEVPGGPFNSIQFNNAGSFGGDANFDWLTGQGWVDLLHAAIGTAASINNATFYPGDPVQSLSFALNSVLLVNEYVSGDLSAGVSANGLDGITVYTGYKHTGSGNGFVFGIDFQPSINSDSTGPFFSFQGVYSFPANFGAGNIAHFRGVNTGIWHNGSGTAADASGVQVFSTLNGPATNYRDLLCLAPAISGAAAVVGTRYGVEIQAPTVGGGAALSNNYGFVVDDQTGKASGNNYNMWSKGASSLNVIEGVLRLGTATNASPQNGDLWYDGTNLNFRTGGTTHVIV